MKLATLCYLIDGDRVLMLRRNKKAGDIHWDKWNGLGGKLDPGETPEQCVVREVFEESGLTIRLPRLRGILTFPEFSAGEDWYVFVYTASDFSGELIDSAEGELAWIEREKLLDLELWEGDRYFLRWIEQERFFSGRFLYRDKKLVEHSAVFYE